MRTVCLSLVAIAALSVSGCDSLRSAAGMAKQSPDEFAVVTKAPLIIPPDFNLRPPSPGAPPLNQADPTAAAQATLFNNNDPVAVAAGLRGNYTAGERMLLANAGAQNADPAIRGQLQSDRPGMQGADPAFTARVLGNTTDPVTRKPATIERSSGWFDWF